MMHCHCMKYAWLKTSEDSIILSKEFTILSSTSEQQESAEIWKAKKIPPTPEIPAWGWYNHFKNKTLLQILHISMQNFSKWVEKWSMIWCRVRPSNNCFGTDSVFTVPHILQYWKGHKSDQVLYGSFSLWDNSDIVINHSLSSFVFACCLVSDVFLKRKSEPFHFHCRLTTV